MDAALIITIVAITSVTTTLVNLINIGKGGDGADRRRLAMREDSYQLEEAPLASICT